MNFVRDGWWDRMKFILVAHRTCAAGSIYPFRGLDFMALLLELRQSHASRFVAVQPPGYRNT
jgi:hypothetical protein